MSRQPGGLSESVQRFLQAVTGGSSGSATSATHVAASQDDFDFGLSTGDANRGGNDLVMHRSSGRVRRILAFALPIVVLVLVLRLAGSQAQSPAVKPVIVEESTPAPATTTPASAGPGFRSYAIEVTELEGLPPNAQPGARLELWVTWEPPLTKSIKVQRLIRTVRLESMVEPVVPEAPATAVLSVPAGNIPDLLYGDRFGALSVSILPDA
jgi:hypothetical protein